MLLRVCDTLGAEWLLNADHIVAIRRGNIGGEVLLTTGEPLVLTSDSIDFILEIVGELPRVAMKETVARMRDELERGSK